MSNLGKKIIAGAKEALTIARGEADPATYTLWVWNEQTQKMEIANK